MCVYVSGYMFVSDLSASVCMFVCMYGLVWTGVYVFVGMCGVCLYVCMRLSLYVCVVCM